MSRFLQQAWKGRSGLPPYVITLLGLVVGAFVVGGVAVLALVWVVSGSIPMEPEATTPEAFGLSDLEFFAVNMVPFVILLGVLTLCIPLLHRRPFRSVITPSDSVDWGRLGIGTFAWMGLMLFTLGMEALVSSETLNISFELGPFLMLLVLALTLIPIQASVEELIMRGYIMQGAARWLRSGWAAVVVSSMLFGLLHWANPEVASFGAGIMMAYYMGFGAFMALITLADDRLELAMGIHIGNNLFGTVIVTFPESVLTTPALIRLDTMAPTPGTLVTWGATAVAFGLIMGRLYGWSWQELFQRLGPVHAPADESEPDDEASPSSGTDDDLDSFSGEQGAGRLQDTDMPNTDAPNTDAPGSTSSR